MRSLAPAAITSIINGSRAAMSMRKIQRPTCPSLAAPISRTRRHHRYMQKCGKVRRNQWTLRKCMLNSKSLSFFSLSQKHIRWGSYSQFFSLLHRMNRTAGSSESATPPRMWTCTKCSYAYNPLWAEACDICALRRPPASLTQPSLITVTKDDAMAKAAANADDKPVVTINRDEKTVKFSKSKSGNSFDEIAAIVEVPMASFEQDLDDDVMFDSGTDAVDAPTPEWTCKKCTLVNSIQNKVCVVCGGSKLKSVSAVEDMTLRKGEFWTCGQCTLKNSLVTNVCIACKSAKQTPVISGQQTNYRPYTSTPANNNNNKQSSGVVHRQQPQPTASNPNHGLAPPIHRVMRSPSPKYDRNASGAIPKVSRTLPLPIYLCLSLSFSHSLSFSCSTETQHRWRRSGQIDQYYKSTQYAYQRCWQLDADKQSQGMALPSLHLRKLIGQRGVRHLLKSSWPGEQFQIVERP